MTRLLLIACCLCTALGAADGTAATPAAAKASPELVADMFTVMRMQEKYEQGLILGFESATEGQVKSLPPEMQVKMARGLKRVKDLMVEKAGWKVVEADFIELYARTFTDEQIRQVIDHLKAPAGQLMLDRELILMKEAMAIGQTHAQALMGDIQTIMMEEMAGGDAPAPQNPE